MYLLVENQVAKPSPRAVAATLRAGAGCNLSDGLIAQSDLNNMEAIFMVNQNQMRWINQQNHLYQDLEVFMLISISENLYLSLHKIIYNMGSQQSQLEQRPQAVQEIDKKITACLKQQKRLFMAHQTNIWALVRRLKSNYRAWQILQIHLDHNMIAGEVVEQLTLINFQTAQPPLRVLNLSFNDIICDNIKTFRRAYFRSLLILHLDHNKIGSDGCFYISKTLLPQLQTLDLSYNIINQNGSGHLSNSILPLLVNLIISHNQLTVKSLRLLSEAPWLSLAHLDAKNNSFQANKTLYDIRFKTQVKGFRLEIQ